MANTENGIICIGQEKTNYTLLMMKTNVGDPYLCLMDPDLIPDPDPTPDPTPFFSNFKDGKFFSYNLLVGKLSSSLKNLFFAKTLC
jgi:hypothetical protein